MLQADAIPYARLDGERFDYASQEERLAYTVLGGLDAVVELSDEVLERNFDYAAFGRRLRDEGMALGDRGYLDPMSSADVRTDLYDRDEVLGALGAEPVAPGSSPTAEHVVDEDSAISTCRGPGSRMIMRSTPSSAVPCRLIWASWTRRAPTRCSSIRRPVSHLAMG